MTPLYEGKAKRLWATENPNTLRMEFKNDATAFNGEKKAQFENKGRLNNAISTLIYGFLEKAGVPTHFVRQIDDTNVEVQKVDILMVEVIVRNLSAGSYCKRTGIEEGRVFSQPIIEFSYKSDELGDPLINDDYIREMGLATPEDLAFLRTSALKVNTILSDFFAKCGLKLVDFKLEFGRLTSDPSIIVLADEISPTAAACGTSNRREDGQGPLPPRPRRRDGSLRGSARCVCRLKGGSRSRWVAHSI